MFFFWGHFVKQPDLLFARVFMYVGGSYNKFPFVSWIKNSN